MKIIGLMIALSALASLCLCSCSTVTLAKQDDEPICANDCFYLTPQQVITKQDEALRGNGRAAQDLSYYYSMLTENTLMDGIWLYIGAKLEDPKCVYNYNYSVNIGLFKPDRIFVIDPTNIRNFQDVPKTDLFLLYFNYQQALLKKDKAKADRCRQELLRQKVAPRLL